MTTTLRHLLPTVAAMARRRDRELSLAEVARQVALSPEHTQRTFRRLMGESPKQFQLRLRVEDSAERLATGDVPDPADWQTEVIWPLAD